MSTHGVWFDAPAATDGGHGCAAWLTPSSSGPSDFGVLVLPPVGYESSSSHRFWRTLAEQLAERGATVLRLDYWGTGDSAGHMAQVHSLQTWRRSAAAAAAHLRSSGVHRLAVVGCQLGAAIAVQDASDLGACGVVAVAPVLSGRRFVRGVAVLGMRAPEEIGGISVGGHYLSAELLDSISDLAVEPPQDLPLLNIESPRVAAVLQRPAEEAEVPDDVITEIVSWIGALRLAPLGEPVDSHGTRVDASARIALREQGMDVVEQLVTLGEFELVGILTRPGADAARVPGVYVLVNSGSDPHVGPGRAWVELARHLAAKGMSTLRVDLRGWGESPDGPTVPGRPYDQHGVDDIVSLVRALHEQGEERVVLGGLCAGAWLALAAATRIDVAGSVVLNPQLYWQPGDPVEALMSTTRARRIDEIAEIRADAAAGRWDAEDEAGLRPPAGVLLDELVRSGGGTSMLFAEGDDGLEYLRHRLGRRLTVATASGRVRVVELVGVDHGMHRTWLRPAAFDAIAAELRTVLETQP